jgi:hypothetical protein
MEVRDGCRVNVVIDGRIQKGTIVSTIIRPTGSLYEIRLLDSSSSLVDREDIISVEGI